MKLCVDCNSEIPYSIVIDEKRRNLRNRTRCLKCLPFGASKYSESSEKERIKRHKARKAKNQRDYYHRFKKNNSSNHIAILRETRKRSLTDLLGGCQICGYTKCQRNLAFHHVDETTKIHNISSREFQFSFRKIQPELLKCILVCHNCHGEIHDGLIEQSLIISLHQHLIEKYQCLTDWP